MPQYSPFMADGSWTPTYDPCWFNTSAFSGGPPLMAQNQLFFTGSGADPGVWSDPLLVNSAAANSWLLGGPAVSLPMDQSQLGVGTGLPLDSTASGLGTGLASDPMATLGQSFGNISLNGGGTSLQSVIPSMTAPTILPGIQNQATFPTADTGNQSTVVTQPAPPVTTAPEKPKSWAAIASQPAKPKPPPPKPPPPPSEAAERPKLAQNYSRAANQSSGHGQGMKGSMASVVSSGGGSSSGGRGSRRPLAAGVGNSKSGASNGGKAGSVPEVVNKLQSENRYNPSEFTLPLNNARYFVIKSYAEDDVHRSIKYSVWCSTEHGNRRLDTAYKDQSSKGGAVYLFFSVNGSGHFCGVAQMVSEVQFNEDTGIWTQDKWRGRFEIKWLYVKDVPNNQLRHIRLENNENKPVTNSRDTQEVLPDKGKQVMKIIHMYQHTTSIFDDFEHYEKRQEEDAGSSSTAASAGTKKVRIRSGGGREGRVYLSCFFLRVLLHLYGIKAFVLPVFRTNHTFT